MKKKVIMAALTLSAMALAQAQVPGTKPGLWESKITKNVVDGKDLAAQMNEQMAKMKERLASMTPEQRAMVESHMNMASGGNGVRFCISPAMAAKHVIAGDPQGHCPSTTVDTSGNKTNFSVNCTYQGRTTVGTGQYVMNGDSVSTHMDARVTDSRGSHTVILDAQMTYLGADCQGIKPIDQK